MFLDLVLAALYTLIGTYISWTIIKLYLHLHFTPDDKLERIHRKLGIKAKQEAKK